MLKLENLKKSFGGVAATRDVTLDFADGSLSAIIGPNGAGKTTLFNLITGRFPPTPGASCWRARTLPACRSAGSCGWASAGPSRSPACSRRSP